MSRKRKLPYWRKAAAASLLCGTLFIAPLNLQVVDAAKITTGTSYVLFHLDKKDVYLNGELHTLDVAPFTQNGKTYVPIKFLGDAFGMKVEWEDKTRRIMMETEKYSIQFDSDNKKVWVNGKETPFSEAALIKNNRLMIKLTWLSDYMGASYNYNHELRSVEVLHTKKPVGVYDPEDKNSTPVAKFAVDKTEYRRGEPIKYINMSYDPDAESIKQEWEGKEDVFFEAGTYSVTLTVTDKRGKKSAPFTRNIVVTDEIYFSEQEYPVYTQPVGGYVKTDWNTLYKYYLSLPELKKTVTEDNSRTLLMSDSPETFKELGILYEDTINGKGRLYADHVNGTGEKVSFAILATNNSDRDITITTTNKGEVFPSIYAHLIGSEAMVDFLMRDAKTEKMIVPSGQTFIYKQFPDFYPSQGVNLMYDVETDGEVIFTFAAAKDVSKKMMDMPKLEFNGHIRGTFQTTAFDWQVDLSEKGLSKPMKVVLGDGKSDPFVQGFDPQRGTEAVLSGNYGTVYKIHADKPRKMAVMLLARGGYFKGPFKINGQMMKAPASGVLTAFDGMVMLAKTTGKEKTFELEFSPPAGSAFPIDIVFYPLDDR